MTINDINFYYVIHKYFTLSTIFKGFTFNFALNKEIRRVLSQCLTKPCSRVKDL